MLMFGDQVLSPVPIRPVRPVWRASACRPRTSVLITPATRRTRSSSKVAARPMGSGKLVVGSEPIAPCSDSVHQL